ncbi:caspase family protein [Sulfurimonas sp. SAG-AH-194-C21]|nr:caspase family protein [Sulfurimonas sp. SAG-AH-194-C21]MDF1883839.1 caspase family protein [Sulfurimonas sp. SAG-AH-194-C21]
MKITILLTILFLMILSFTSCGRRGVALEVPKKVGTDDFSTLLTGLTQRELKKLPKPASVLNLQKDQYETSQEFDNRVSKSRKTQQLRVEKYQKEYILNKSNAQLRAMKEALQYTWGKPLMSNLQYDAENSYFLADIRFENKKDFHKKIAFKVSRKEARDFGNVFEVLQAQAIFEYDGKSVRLKDIRIPYKKKAYLTQFTNMTIDDTRVAVDIQNDINIDTSYQGSKIRVTKNSVSTFDTSKLTNFSELDKLLATSKAVKQDKTKWLFVVGIEQYEFTDNISYAKRSAEMFVKIAKKKLGVPNANSYVLINSKASQAHIKTSMKKMLRRVKEGDSIYFYYNGHGVPVPSLKNEPFMLTADTEPDYVGDEKFFSLQNIYSKLADSKAKKIVAIVDSCFSGVTDGKSVLKGVAATKMVAKSVSFNKEKMVVLSAGKSNQYSNGYNKKGHRLFSFYIMKNIIEGGTTIKKLYKDTKIQTYETSIEEYGDSRTQEPTIEGNFRMEL